MYQYNFSKSSTGAPFITLDQIESLTEQILNKYCPSAIENFEAVDIEGLAEFDLGFNVEYAYLSHNGCYAGMMVFNDDQVIRTMKSLMPNVETGQWELEYLTDRANTILIDKQLDNPRDKGFRRFTLAHECGHFAAISIFYKGILDTSKNLFLQTGHAICSIIPPYLSLLASLLISFLKKYS